VTLNLVTVEVGQSVGVTATVMDPVTEQPMDASTALWDLDPPDDNNVLDQAPTSHPSTGVYVYVFTVNQRGTWGLRFHTTAPDTVAECHITGDWSVIT
jgi:hypothetical protein